MKTIKRFTNRAELALAVPAGGLFLELGVASGRFADAVLSINPAMSYLGIDRWSDHHDLDEMLTAQDAIQRHGARAALMRSTFADALPKFRDGSVDLIYVDGYAHTGQDGGQTLADWWPKVKPGGIFAGHDYAPQYQPTIDAVDAFAKSIGAEVEVITESPYSSWLIRKNSQAEAPEG